MAVNSSKMKSKKSSSQAASQPLSSSPKKPAAWSAMLYVDQDACATFLINRLNSHGGAGLLSDPGTGKTIVSMAVIEHFMPKRLLIVAPLTSLEVTWAKRLRSLYGNIVNSIHDYVDGVLLIGFEHFRANIKKIVKYADKHGFDMALIDESQGLKTRSSLQSRGTRRLRLKVPKRIILSGTPIDESPLDMWAQMRFIDPTVFGDVWAPPRDKRKYIGPYFEEEFCRSCGYMGYSREFRPEMMPEFLRRIVPVLCRLSNDMEQPELIPVYCDLEPDQRRVYDQMDEHSIVKIDGRKCKAALKPVKDIRLFQIVGGSIKMDDGSVIRTGNGKERALERILARVDRPVVFCRFLEELRFVADILSDDFDNVRTLDGSIKDKKNDKARTRLIEDFQAKKIGALAVQARTGGVSIEFTATHELIFYSMGYSYIDFQQIIARFRRYGQEKRVRVWLIIARNTIDEEPLKRVMTKSDTVNPIMDHIKENTMAEAKKAAKKVAKKAPAKKVAKKDVEKLAIGVDYIAEKLDVSESSARKYLRDCNIEKNGKSYGWKSKADADVAVKKIDKVREKATA